MVMYYNEPNCLGNSSEIIVVWKDCHGPMIDTSSGTPVEYWIKLSGALSLAGQALVSCLVMGLAVAQF